MPYGKKSPATMGHSPLEGHCMGSAAKMGHSPAEMGHSPMQNHHYGKRKGESVKQEKYNLMHDNPVAKHASWMSKHAMSSRMSPMNMGHSPAEMGHDSPAEMHGGIHPIATAKALGGAAIKAAKKVKKAITESKPYRDLFEGGFSKDLKRRQMRGGAKPAKIFKK